MYALISCLALFDLSVVFAQTLEAHFDRLGSLETNAPKTPSETGEGFASTGLRMRMFDPVWEIGLAVDTGPTLGRV